MDIAFGRTRANVGDDVAVGVVGINFVAIEPIVLWIISGVFVDLGGLSWLPHSVLSRPMRVRGGESQRV